MNWDGIELGKIITQAGKKSSPPGRSRKNENGINFMKSYLT